MTSRKGDILLSKNGTIGITKVVDWDEEFSIFVSLCLIKVDTKQVIPEFLSYFIQSDIAVSQLKFRAKQGTVTNLHLEEIRELVCGLPSIEEQRKIVEIISSIESKIRNEQINLLTIRQMKRGLMQVLLSGKVRVKVDDQEEVTA